MSQPTSDNRRERSLSPGLWLLIAVLLVFAVGGSVFAGSRMHTARQSEGTVLFDDDPRTNRRYGVRNPDASFCSGFDTECGFENCPVGYRLVWGPYCREYDYPAIQPGAYRVTIDGDGAVVAGATDYGATGDLFAYWRQEADLPVTYNFCWPGLGDAGYGFETIVTAVDEDAHVDNIKVEYLGSQCP